jgi:hypothetical protein
VIAGVESESVGELAPVNVAPDVTINDGCAKLLGWLVEEPPASE